MPGTHYAELADAAVFGKARGVGGLVLADEPLSAIQITAYLGTSSGVDDLPQVDFLRTGHLSHLKEVKCGTDEWVSLGPDRSPQTVWREE